MHFTNVSGFPEATKAFGSPFDRSLSPFPSRHAFVNTVVLSRQLGALAAYETWLGGEDAVLFCDATRVEGYACFREVRPMQEC
jgi:hypothetical protein